MALALVVEADVISGYLFSLIFTMELLLCRVVSLNSKVYLTGQVWTLWRSVSHKQCISVNVLIVKYEKLKTVYLLC